MQSHADIVKKGYLKYKASKVKGKNGAAALGPKTAFKELFVVFRAPSGGEKFLDFYQNDRKYAEVVQPKWTVDLSTAVCVNVFNDNRVCFYIEQEGGGMCLLEAKTLGEAEDWIACFNAVLFTKGMHGEDVLLYEVDLYQSDLLQYHGPAYLELTDGYLIVWTRGTQEEVVRWKLSHIRSFKAKKMVLTIYTGSRSSTGVGEFYFNSRLSVQITHAIETLVARLKSQKLQGGRANRPTSGRRPLPPAPAHPINLESPDGMPNLLEYSTENGGGQISSSLSANIPGFNPTDVYEDIPETAGNHVTEDGGRGGASASNLNTSEVFGRLDHNPQSNRRSSPRPSRGRMDYEDIPDGEHQQNGSQTPPRIERHKPSPPPIPKPYKESVNVEAMYAQVDKAKKSSRPVSVVPETNSRLARKQFTSSHPDLTSDSSAEPYGLLQHFDTSTCAATVEPEEYGKLSRPNKPKPQVPPTFQQEEYGRLDHTPLTTLGGFSAEEYGKLDRPNDNQKPPEYGKLENASGSTQQASGYGKLEFNRQSTFDPYGSLSGEELEQQIQAKQNAASDETRLKGYETMDFDDMTCDGAIYSEIDEKKGKHSARDNGLHAPPPGYENASLKKSSPAEDASYKLRNTKPEKTNSSPPPPPRSARSSNHGYVNVKENDSVKQPAAPPPPRRNKSSPTEERKNGLRKGHSLDDNLKDELSPPVPPYRGASVHGNRGSPPRTKKPPPAPKPKPPVKPKP